MLLLKEHESFNICFGKSHMATAYDYAIAYHDED